ncbi:alpha/beta fold hydrolase [Nocardia bovistercoris]|uniref:Alpha/beta fold hydrolase n=1 Tax=Nocardia bovistercoris TaxID=2785916 RepID=A0A931IGE4_9NOCA|nr:alpha/beta hydrolase [Nocardia bovistercoris]MBH0780959.1 alpha/beta fold hydrolase [Nocardia bovistercoris]
MSKLDGALAVDEGVLAHDLPYFAFGAGPPLVFLRWFSPDHANPSRWIRNSEIKTLGPLARWFRVYAVTRAPGMAAGTSMADIAAEHARALDAEFGAAVDVLGISSGGSVALQLAADHPGVVRRLVVAASGYRLEEQARADQMNYAEAAAAGRRALHHMAPHSAAVKDRLITAAMWLFDPFVRPRNPADTLAFVRAEDAFDLSDRLGDIKAPTLVIGGERDEFYSTESFRRTADGIPRSLLSIYPNVGHVAAITHPRFARDIVDFLDES